MNINNRVYDIYIYKCVIMTVLTIDGGDATELHEVGGGFRLCYRGRVEVGGGYVRGHGTSDHLIRTTTAIGKVHQVTAVLLA